MSTGDRSEQQDQHGEPERGGDRILQQLQPNIVRRQLSRGDAGTDYHGDEKAGADKLGQQPSGKGMVRARPVVHRRQQQDAGVCEPNVSESAKTV